MEDGLVDVSGIFCLVSKGNKIYVIILLSVPDCVLGHALFQPNLTDKRCLKTNDVLNTWLFCVKGRYVFVYLFVGVLLCFFVVLDFFCLLLIFVCFESGIMKRRRSLKLKFHARDTEKFG